MSKESTFGSTCPGCHQSIAFMEYHEKHCKGLKVLQAAPPSERKRKRKRKRSG